MKYQPGQDIIIEFDGIDHRAHVIEHRHGTVMAVMQTDPAADYGSGTDRMAPQQTVCVAEHKVKLCDTTAPHKNMPSLDP
jgi:hypothetical protein